MTGKLLKTSLLALVGSASTLAFAETSKCEVKFDTNSAVPSSSDIESCLSKAEGSIESAYVIGTASKGGSLSYNYNLSQRRAQSIANAIKARLPDAKIETFAAGSSADSLSAKVLITAAEDTSATPVAAVVIDQSIAQQEQAQEEYQRSSTLNREQEAGLTPDQHSARIAVRLGNDIYDPADERYPSAGLDIGYVRNNVLLNNMRLEMGTTASVLQDASQSGMEQIGAASAHAYVGPGFGVKSFVVGARGMVGSVWDSARKWQIDTGGEGRIGFESDSFSVFAGLGRTTYTTRLGVDVGVNF